MIRAAAVVIGVAFAAKATADTAPPDRNAEERALEANLESGSKHDGIVVTGAFGGALVFGDGIGRGPGGSFRAGYRKRDVVETFEVTIGSLLHAPPGDMTHYNNDINLMAGVQFYTTTSLWLRTALGVTVYKTDDPQPTGAHTYVGGGVLFGVGLDIARTRHFVIDLELFDAMSIVKTKGLLVTSALGLGFSLR